MKMPEDKILAKIGHKTARTETQRGLELDDCNIRLPPVIKHPRSL